jgi:protein subunit release factor A
MDLQERKKIVKQNLIVEIEKPRPIGGQNCGTPIYATIIKSEELEIEIKVKCFKSNHKNKEIALLLMDLAIDDLIR